MGPPIHHMLLSLSQSVLQIIDPGGTCNFLYRLHKQPADTAGNALGKLEIKWHGTMGEVGRLQTQQIMGSATWRKVRSLLRHHPAASHQDSTLHRQRSGAAKRGGHTALQGELHGDDAAKSHPSALHRTCTS